jgi:uracil-DNA glycosylase
MTCENNIEEWLSDASAEVRSKTETLLAQVADMREAGQVIYPPQHLVLNALATTSPAAVRVVIVGQDPYHEPGQAMGLSFSVPAGCKLPPSLRNIYKELAADLGCVTPKSGDLTAWAHSGVLLLNTTLTVLEHKANSHAKLGWSVLTDYVIQRCMTLPQPIVFLAWGRNAIDLIKGAKQNAEQVCDAGDESLVSKFILASTHPSPLSATRPAGAIPAFIGSRPFSRANKLLAEAGGDPVDWLAICDVGTSSVSEPAETQPTLF